MSTCSRPNSSLPRLRERWLQLTKPYAAAYGEQAKTLFFISNMVASLLLICAPPLFVLLLDLLLPSTLLAAVNGQGFSSPSFASQVGTFRFRDSSSTCPSFPQSDPSSVRALTCAVMDGSRTWASAGYVLVKAIAMFWPDPVFAVKEVSAVEAHLFLTSLALAMAHVVVAYRNSCRERRKLVVYKTDVEAVAKIIKKTCGLTR